MTNPVALVSLAYDGTDVQSATFDPFLEIVRGLDDSPEVRGVDTVVPGRAGRVAGSRVFDRRSILLEGVMLCDTPAAYRTAMLALRSLFDPTRAPAALVAGLEDGSTATVTARPLNVLAARTSPSSCTLSVELEALEHWAYS